MPKIEVEGETPFEAEAGKKLVLAIEDAGIDILHRCGGVARCTTCRVHFASGEPSEMGEAERATLEEDGLLGEWRLSCQVHIASDDMALSVWGRASEKGIPAGTRPED